MNKKTLYINDSYNRIEIDLDNCIKCGEKTFIHKSIKGYALIYDNCYILKNTYTNETTNNEYFFKNTKEIFLWKKLRFIPLDDLRKFFFKKEYEKLNKKIAETEEQIKIITNKLKNITKRKSELTPYINNNINDFLFIQNVDLLKQKTDNYKKFVQLRKKIFNEKSANILNYKKELNKELKNE